MTPYPRIIDRIKAVTADSIIIIILLFSTTAVFAAFEHVHDNVKIMAFVFIFILYDPLLTSVLGGTIGHMILGIRVKRKVDEKKNILFPLAIIRYIFKILLGWISLLSISTDSQSRAIHDLIAGSVVVYARKK